MKKITDGSPGRGTRAEKRWRAVAAERNKRMDLFKCLAIYSVVFLHIKSGVQSWDWTVTALTRWAVPYFFLVSGYFAWEKRPGRLLRQAGRSALMWAAALGLVLALCAAMILRHPGWSVWEYIRGQLTGQALRELLIGQVVPYPYAYHIWYIGALPLLYLIWSGLSALAARLGGRLPYRPLALLSCGLLALHFCLSEGMGMLGREPLSPLLLRNAWLDGFSFFALGAWMHHDREKLRALARPAPAAVLLLGSLLLTLEEQRLAGMVDLFFGSALTAVLLMVLAIGRPEVGEGPLRRAACWCGGRLTFLIYALHVPLHSALFIEWQGGPAILWGANHPRQVPFAIAALSTGLAVLLWLLARGGKAWARGRLPHKNGTGGN